MNNDVDLETYEENMAAFVGVRRHISWKRKGLAHRNGMDEENGWRANIEGACGELAAAKFLNVYWDGSVDTFQTQSDLRGHVEVKTRTSHNRDLIVRSNELEDKPDEIYIHVTGTAPNFKIRGWIKAKDVPADPSWWRTYDDRPKAWFVPTEALNTDWEEYRRLVEPMMATT
jgi:hypothetical protein